MLLLTCCFKVGDENEAQSLKYVGQIGCMGPFDEMINDWDNYAESFTQFFTANDIGEDKKVSALW